MAKTSSEHGGAANAGFSAYLPLLLAMILMPAVAYLTLKYLPGLKKGKLQIFNTSTNQPAAPKTNELKLAKQKAQPRMPVPLANGHLAFHPDVGKKPGPLRLVLTNAPKAPNFIVTLKLADPHRQRYAIVEVLMLADNTDELIAKANLHQPELFERATNLLSKKTAEQILKPGARNTLRTELQALSNQVLGSNTVHEILIPTLLVQ